MLNGPRGLWTTSELKKGMIPKEKWLELSAGTLRTGGGLLSLWDMLRFHADRFYSLISKLETVSRMSDTLLVQNDAGGLGKVFAKHVGELDQICADIGLVVSRKKLPEIFKVFERGMELYPGELSGMVAELNGRIRHELEDKYVFVLSAKNYERFEQLTPIFGALMMHFPAPELTSQKRASALHWLAIQRQ